MLVCSHTLIAFVMGEYWSSNCREGNGEAKESNLLEERRRKRGNVAPCDVQDLKHILHSPERFFMNVHLSLIVAYLDLFDGDICKGLGTDAAQAIASQIQGVVAPGLGERLGNRPIIQLGAVDLSPVADALQKRAAQSLIQFHPE